MEEKKNILTYEGLKKYEDELHELKVVRRKDVAQKLKEARAQGDLSENAEYDAAKDEQGKIEARITELEAFLKNATVISADEIDSDKISIGCTVVVRHVEKNMELTYKLVGTTEVDAFDPEIRKISNESPVGIALNGKKVGEIVTIEAPGGTYQYEVIRISR